MEINKIYNENCLDTMKRMEDNFVDLTVTSPPYDCYSEDTEILTKNGWKFIKDVIIGDFVMTLNPETKEIIYQDVINTYNYDFLGELINFKNQDIDLCVTENHNMFITDKKGSSLGSKDFKTKKEFLRKAIDINKNGHIPYNGFIWKGNEDEYFYLPSLDCIYNKQNIHFESKKINMLWWVRFLGIYLAEGSCRNTIKKSNKIKSYEISIKQKDIIFCNMIRETFKNLPFVFKERKDRDMCVFSITDRQLWDYLYKLGNSYEKYIPHDIKQLDAFYLKELLLYMFIGDGTKRKDFNINDFNLDDFLNYKSHSDLLKNDVQEILLKVGKLSNIHKNHLVSNKKYSYIKYNSMFIEKKKYEGKVVCVEVKDFNIICVRRNGKVVWCGNCLRKYTGECQWNFEVFQEIAKELYRVTKEGGVVVWIVGDATIKGSETGTSFRQALYFKEIGFNLHDTMMYLKDNPVPLTHNRYEQGFEYMFVLSKGKPKTFNPIMIDCKYAGTIKNRKNTLTSREYSNEVVRVRDEDTITKNKKIKTNTWNYVVGGKNIDGANIHPAIFPEQLANDHIVSWSNEGDIVYDCFMGSGTTAKMAILNNRNYIGSEISKEYCDIIEDRLNKLT